ncbi:MAG: UDP-glucose/GDP-mannose dehydrogenase family protein [Acidobacteria bacterium]|nr:UDP-glucose/GDP-mannose dehydrogenase family protein [Acidobacteriota bacterium]
MHTESKHLDVAVVGSGYVGLVTGACLASLGHRVICVDTDDRKVEAINARVAPIFEPGLDELLRSLPGERFSATTDLARAIAATDVSMIAVGTPFDGTRIDLSSVEAAARDIGRALAGKTTFHVVVVKSTVIPGTTDGLVTAALEEGSGKTAGVDFGVAMNPEFLRQGEALRDFLEPDRIVIGAGDPRTVDRVSALYAAFDHCPHVITTTKTAEMIKYTANSLLATLISFSNEIGNLCEAVGDVDAMDVMRGVHLDRRLTPTDSSGARISPAVLGYLQAGCGFGGSCFPKDVKALLAHGQAAAVPMPMLDAVLSINAQQPARTLELLRKRCPELGGRRVSVLGLAFKAGTDDMRESPAIPIVRALLDAGATVTAYDPVAGANAARIFGSTLALADSVADAIAGADAILVLTNWPAFVDLPRLVALRDPQPVVVDARRVFPVSAFERYEGTGLNTSSSPLMERVPV